jgi:hypothetical protein
LQQKIVNVKKKYLQHADERNAWKKVNPNKCNIRMKTLQHVWNTDETIIATCRHRWQHLKISNQHRSNRTSILQHAKSTDATSVHSECNTCGRWL